MGQKSYGSDLANSWWSKIILDDTREHAVVFPYVEHMQSEELGWSSCEREIR